MPQLRTALSSIAFTSAKFASAKFACAKVASAKVTIARSIVAATLGTLCLGAPAGAVAQTAVGQLHCSVAGGFGFVVGSSRGTTCTYYRPDGLADFYTGSSARVGLDVGPASAVDVLYDVVAARPLGHRALEGGYAGAGAGATIGEGLGAMALVGGRDQAVTLVPAKNAALTGLNVNAGFATLDLHYVGSERPERVERIYR